ncbi:MAG: hypothetical protein JXA13_16465 [Anaerolineales bacterium]|nr:hypothetical protein [Anaerolineales bacterium]
MLTIILVTACLILFGLIMAERGREHLPAEPWNAALEAVGSLAAYFCIHPNSDV